MSTHQRQNSRSLTPNKKIFGQYERPLNRPDLTAYHEFGTELEEWKEGIEIARRLARLVGMAPEGDGNDHVDYDGDGHDGGGTDNGVLAPI